MTKYSLEVERSERVGAGIDFADPNGPLAPYYLRNGHVVTAVLLTALFVLLNFAKLWHTDLWGHLRFGEQIIDSRSFLAGEVFCPFAEPTVFTVNYCWLSQVAFAAVFRAGQWLAGGDAVAQLAGGADALRFLLAVIVILRFIALYFAFFRASQSNLLAAAGLLFIASVSLSLAVIRPQIFAELLFALLLIPLSGAEVSRRAVILIPCILVIWANAHGSYPIGFILLGVVAGGRLVGHLVGPSPRWFLASIDVSLRRLILAGVLGLVGVAFLNPEGPRIFAVTLEMARQPNVRAMDEWQPIWSPVAGGAQIGMALGMALILVGLVAARGRPGGVFVLGLVAFAVPPVLSQRAILWFLTVAPWLVLPAMGEAVRRWSPTWWHSVPSFRKTMLVGMCAGLAVMWSIPAQAIMGQRNADLRRSLSDGTPWPQALAITDSDAIAGSKLVEAITAHYPDGRFSGGIFANETLGDFFLWRLTAPVPIYMYSHVHLFSPEQWGRYVAIRDARGGWEPLLDRAAINLVVLYAEQKLPLQNQLRRSPGWLVVTDETGDRSKPDPRNRLFVALRKVPAGRVQ